MRLSAAALSLSAAFCCSLAISAARTFSLSSQSPLRLPDDSPIDAIERDSFFIFNSVHHLLRQWGNTISPNGFSFTRGIIPAGTNLYHARGDAHIPHSPDWLAFAPEMSYGIMAHRCSTFLRTYRVARPLTILYIDGNSASLTRSGTLDSQDIIMYGHVTTKGGYFDEFERAEKLCKWGQPRGIDGFVRQNSGFELIKCSFEDGLKLITNLNVTNWVSEFFDPPEDGAPRRCTDRWPPDEPDGTNTSDVTHLSQVSLGELMLERSLVPAVDSPRGGTPTPGRNGTRSRPPPFMQITPFSNRISFEWARIAAAVYDGTGEYRVKLDSGTLVTAYGRSGLHGVDSPNTTDHRLTNLTREAADDMMLDIESFFPSPSHPHSLHSSLVPPVAKSSGIDWRDVADNIVDRYADRLPELFTYLSLAAEPELDANSTKQAFASARMLLSMLLIPHYDFSLSDSDAREAKEENVRVCTAMFVPQLDDIPDSVPTRSERVIESAVTHTQGAICQTLMDLYDLLFVPAPEEKREDEQVAQIKHLASLARDGLSGLMNDLRWTKWKSCNKKCGYEEICLITLWPLSGFDFRHVEPRCANATNWRDGWGRGRRRKP